MKILEEDDKDLIQAQPHARHPHSGARLKRENSL